MLLKNKLISLLFLASVVGHSHILHSMNLNKDNKKQEEQLKKLKQQQQEAAIKLAEAKAKAEIIENQQRQEEQEAKRKTEIEQRNLREDQIKKQNEELKRAKEDHDYNNFKREEAAKKLKDDIETEALKVAKEKTQEAIYANDAKRQIGMTTIKSFTDGVAKGAGDSIVEIVKKELDYLYSQYRPTQITLFSEIEAASRIIRQGIDIISENYDRQLKLIQTSSHKDPKIIAEKIRILKKETQQAYEDLQKMENESRRRLTESYGYRNPDFKENMNKPTPNIFDEPTPDPKDQNTPPVEPKPGRIKRIANFITENSILAADAIANTLPINSRLDQLTKTEHFKNSWVDTYKTKISRVAALGLVATTLAILYKSYSWYTNEDRRLACDAVVQLEEQKQEIALQFAKEMSKPTVSAEDKAKLQIAYNNYMQDLQVEIDEQRAIAGYNIPKKLLIGAGVAATGIVGIITFAKYYLNNQPIAPIDLPQNNYSEITHHTIIDTAPEDPEQNTNNHTANDNSKLENDTNVPDPDTKKQFPKLRLKGHP